MSKLIPLILLFASGCATTHVYQDDYGPALDQLKANIRTNALQNPDTGMPSQYERQSHTCVSRTLINFDGSIGKTLVNCI